MTHVQELFIKNLRFLRNKNNLTQLAFSERIGISPNYLNAVEKGKNFPSPEVLQKIADELNILPYELFLETPESEEQTSKNQIVEKILRDIELNFTEMIDKYKKEKNYK